MTIPKRKSAFEEIPDATYSNHLSTRCFSSLRNSSFMFLLVRSSLIPIILLNDDIMLNN